MGYVKKGLIGINLKWLNIAKSLIEVFCLWNQALECYCHTWAKFKHFTYNRLTWYSILFQFLEIYVCVKINVVRLNTKLKCNFVHTNHNLSIFSFCLGYWSCRPCRSYISHINLFCDFSPHPHALVDHPLSVCWDTVFCMAESSRYKPCRPVLKLAVK